ncbi:MAG: hypothetical protein R3F59_18080 [Myxococcota bacterium]
MLLLVCLASLNVAHAKSTRWFREGAEEVQFNGGQIDVPLYRGPTTRYLPTVEVQIAVAAEDVRPALAVVDLAGGWSRLGAEAASSLGIQPDFEKFQGEWRRVAVLPEVRVRDVIFRNVHVEVVSDAPGLVLGIEALPQVAVAILPSEGVVRWVPAKYGAALVQSLGTPIPATRQTSGTWSGPEGRVHGDGLKLQVHGAMRWGEAVVEGSFHLRTDLQISRVAPSSRLPEPVMRAGEPFHDVGARLGEVWLPDTWISEDAALTDPAPDFSAALGYDVLFGLDIAVAPETGLVSLRQATPVKSENATPVSVKFARARYDREEERARETGEGTRDFEDPTVKIRFDKDQPKYEIPLGDPGKPAIRDRNLDLAETLWWAGNLEEALPYYLAASQSAGDACSPYLRLGERRLAMTGTRIKATDGAKLVLDPIFQAATLWDVWQGLDARTRAAIRDGRDVPKGGLQVFQPPECRIAFGLLTAVDRLRGDTEKVQEIESKHLADHPSIAYTRGLVALSEGRYAGADPLLAVALSMEAVDEVDLQVALARAKAGQGQLEDVIAIAKEIPGYPTEHPLTAALGLLEAARSMAHPGVVTKKLVRADDRWVPGQLVHALATGVAPPDWDPATEQRQPGSPQVACQKAVHLALTGNLREASYLLRLERWPGFADWWAALAVVTALAGDTNARDEALLNLRVRFPLLPVGTLGLP